MFQRVLFDFESWESSATKGNYLGLQTLARAATIFDVDIRLSLSGSRMLNKLLNCYFD